MPPKHRHWYEPTIIPRGALLSDGESAALDVCDASQHPLDADAAPIVPRLEVRVPIPGHRFFVFDALAWLVRALLVGCGWGLAWLVAEAGDNAALAEPARGGAVFDSVAVLLFSACLGGTTAAAMRIPGIATILLSSVLFTHIGPRIGYLTGGVPPELNKFASLFAVAVIVTRAGLALNFKSLASTWKPVLALAVVPLVMEAVAHAVVARYTFNEVYENTGAVGGPWTWALLQGFVASPIAPGVVVPGYIALRAGRFGRPPGHDDPAFVSCVDLLLGAVVLDAVVGLWAANFVASIVRADPTAGSGPIAIAAVLGPVQLLAGCIIGVLAGVLAHVSVSTWLGEAGFGKLVQAAAAADDDSRENEPLSVQLLATADARQNATTRVAHAANLMVGGLAVVSVFGGDLLQLPGGASIAVAAMAATFVNLSLTVDPPALAKARNEASTEATPAAERTPNAEMTGVGAETGAAAVPAASDADAVRQRLAVESEDAFAVATAAVRMRVLGTNGWIWDAAAMPLLFAVTGTTVDLAQLFAGDFISRAIGPCLVGVLARAATAAFVVRLGSNATGIECLFGGIAWTGKGAVQAALARIGFSLLDAASFATPADVVAASPAAETIRNVALLVGLLFAPFGCLVVSLAGPMMLRDGSVAPVEDDSSPSEPSTPADEAVVAARDEGAAVVAEPAAAHASQNPMDLPLPASGDTASGDTPPSDGVLDGEPAVAPGAEDSPEAPVSAVDTSSPRYQRASA